MRPHPLVLFGLYSFKVNPLKYVSPPIYISLHKCPVSPQKSQNEFAGGGVEGRRRSTASAEMSLWRSGRSSTLKLVGQHCEVQAHPPGPGVKEKQVRAIRGQAPGLKISNVIHDFSAWPHSKVWQYYEELWLRIE